jgi:hypothetical protein
MFSRFFRITSLTSRPQLLCAVVLTTSARCASTYNKTKKSPRKHTTKDKWSPSKVHLSPKKKEGNSQLHLPPSGREKKPLNPVVKKFLDNSRYRGKHRKNSKKETPPKATEVMTKDGAPLEITQRIQTESARQAESEATIKMAQMQKGDVPPIVPMNNTSPQHQDVISSPPSTQQAPKNVEWNSSLYSSRDLGGAPLSYYNQNNNHSHKGGGDYQAEIHAAHEAEMERQVCAAKDTEIERLKLQDQPFKAAKDTEIELQLLASKDPAVEKKLQAAAWGDKRL